MASEIIGMFAQVTGGTQDARAQIDIPQDGVILGIDWDASWYFDAEEKAEIELSFIATNQLDTNDVRGRLSSISAHNAEVTAVGHNPICCQKWLGGIELVVAGGERVYLHSVATAGVNGEVRCNLYVDLGATMRRSARRR